MVDTGNCPAHLIPRRVTMGPHTYEIRSDPDTVQRLVEEDSRGDARPDSLLIRIDPNRPHTAVAETLLHEVLHCAWEGSAITSAEDADHWQEPVVTALAPLLLDALRRNPHLVSYLTEG